MIGNEPDAIELYGPGEIVAGHEFYDYAAKYTAGLSETTTSAEVTPAPSARRSSSSRATPTARPAARGSRAWTSCSPATELVVSEINTIPGFTPISLFPTLPAAAGYDFAAVCRRVVDLALEREAGARPPPPDRRGPAALMRAGPGRRSATRPAPRRRAPRRRAPAARRPPHPLGPAPVRGPHADAGRRAARARRRARRASTARPARARSPLQADRGQRRDLDARGRGARGARHPRRPEPVHAGHRRARSTRLAAIPAIRGASITVALPGRGPGRRRGARARCSSGRSAPTATSSTRTGCCSARIDADLARGRRGAARSSTTSASPPAALAVGRHARPGHPRRRAPARLAAPGRPRHGRVAARDPRSTTRTGFTLKAEPVGWSAVFGFYTPTLRTTDLIPGQVRLLRSMLAGPRGRRPAGDPRRRPQRHLRPARRRLALGRAEAGEDAEARQVPAP